VPSCWATAFALAEAELEPADEVDALALADAVAAAAAAAKDCAAAEHLLLSGFAGQPPVIAQQGRAVEMKPITVSM
jgi:hypothetical protein